MMNRFVSQILLIVLISSVAIGQNYQPKQGYVPDAKTAIKIAEAIWFPVYGEKIYNHKPFIAKLKDGKVWIVQGTLHEELGGVPYIEIQKMDCKILKMIHGK